jgi:hypothetical protein
MPTEKVLAIIGAATPIAALGAFIVARIESARKKKPPALALSVILTLRCVSMSFWLKRRAVSRQEHLACEKIERFLLRRNDIEHDLWVMELDLQAEILEAPPEIRARLSEYLDARKKESHAEERAAEEKLLAQIDRVKEEFDRCMRKYDIYTRFTVIGVIIAMSILVATIAMAVVLPLIRHVHHSSEGRGKGASVQVHPSPYKPHGKYSVSSPDWADHPKAAPSTPSSATAEPTISLQPSIPAATLPPSHTQIPAATSEPLICAGCAVHSVTSGVTGIISGVSPVTNRVVKGVTTTANGAVNGLIATANGTVMNLIAVPGILNSVIAQDPALPESSIGPLPPHPSS